MPDIAAGLATISAAWDDTPNIRGAIAFCRDAAASRDAAQALTDSVADRAFVDHAALAISEAFRAQDARALVFRQNGVEIVRQPIPSEA